MVSHRRFWQTTLSRVSRTQQVTTMRHGGKAGGETEPTCTEKTFKRPALATHQRGLGKLDGGGHGMPRKLWNSFLCKDFIEKYLKLFLSIIFERLPFEKVHQINRMLLHCSCTLKNIVPKTRDISLEVQCEVKTFPACDFSEIRTDF